MLYFDFATQIVSILPTIFYPGGQFKFTLFGNTLFLLISRYGGGGVFCSPVQMSLITFFKLKRKQRARAKKAPPFKNKKIQKIWFTMTNELNCFVEVYSCTKICHFLVDFVLVCKITKCMAILGWKIGWKYFGYLFFDCCMGLNKIMPMNSH